MKEETKVIKSDLEVLAYELKDNENIAEDNDRYLIIVNMIPYLIHYIGLYNYFSKLHTNIFKGVYSDEKVIDAVTNLFESTFFGMDSLKVNYQTLIKTKVHLKDKKKL